ncbi:putative Zn-dependent protease [Sphaerotilus hippei]|uniref:Putative Zn-dependent protease n=1 Tax=Sphaerotilus hippei TaxID=744406 RepID=A0A318GUT9_9BURK|nr:M48 family metalloprotease [Sphaerotilus hippei]PXW91868.1 putative Zn-dependent protease [Sphaerotilus hippei]
MSVTIKNGFKTVLLAALMAGLPLAPGLGRAAPGDRQALPALGDATSEDLSVADERRLGDRIMSQILPDPDVVDDPLLQEYLDSLWQPLLAAARQRGDLTDELDQHYAWKAFLVRDRTVNAFALPGGYIGVHLGLISVTGSSDELASVLAHELSHVTQRHIARSMATQRRQSMLSLASLLLGVLAASRSPDAANAILTGGQAVAMQGQLNFSRDMEREADRIGFSVLSGAGFDPGGMAHMFDHLQQASRLMDNNQYPYLRSHPLTTERIAEARSRLGIGALPVAEPPGAAAWLHAAMQGRVRALMDTRTESLRRLVNRQGAAEAGGREGISASPAALAEAYAASLAARRLKDRATEDSALARARTLAAPYPGARRAVRILQVESLLARGQAVEAGRLLETAEPDASRAGMLLSCSVALAGSGPQAGLQPCAETLQAWVAQHADDSTAWTQLAQARERQGQPLAALRAQAEVQLAQGNTRGALDRLRAGQQLARSTRTIDSLEAAVIDTRLKRVEQLRREEMNEERNGDRAP